MKFFSSALGYKMAWLPSRFKVYNWMTALLLMLYGVAIATATECRSGYGNGTICGVCAKGFYSTPGATSCTPCPEGQTTRWPGSRPGACVCSAMFGGANCAACPAGSFSYEGQSSCTSCSFTSTAATDSCVCAPGSGGYPCRICPKGTYNPGGLFTSCYKCPSGKTTPGEGTSSVARCMEDASPSSTVDVLLLLDLSHARAKTCPFLVETYPLGQLSGPQTVNVDGLGVITFRIRLLDCDEVDASLLLEFPAGTTRFRAYYTALSFGRSSLLPSLEYFNVHSIADVVLPFAPQIPAPICPPGTAGTPCKECPVGTYGPGGSFVDCQKCPFGKTTAKAGTKTYAECNKEVVGQPARTTVRLTVRFPYLDCNDILGDTVFFDDFKVLLTSTLPLDAEVSSVTLRRLRCDRKLGVDIIYDMPDALKEYKALPPLFQIHQGGKDVVTASPVVLPLSFPLVQPKVPALTQASQVCVPGQGGYPCRNCVVGTYGAGGFSDCLGCPYGKTTEKEGATSAAECTKDSAGGDGPPVDVILDFNLQGTAQDLCPHLVAAVASTQIDGHLIVTDAVIGSHLMVPYVLKCSDQGAQVALEFYSGSFRFTAYYAALVASQSFMKFFDELDSKVSMRVLYPPATEATTDSPGCAPGSGGYPCELCPAGTYGPGGLFVDCQACPWGKTTDGAGAQTLSQCNKVVETSGSAPLEVGVLVSFLNLDCQAAKEDGGFFAEFKEFLSIGEGSPAIREVICQDGLTVSVKLVLPAGARQGDVLMPLVLLAEASKESLRVTLASARPLAPVGDNLPVVQDPSQGCPAGSGGSPCVRCPVGTYSPGEAFLDCRECPQGTTTASDGSPSQASCVKGPASPRFTTSIRLTMAGVDCSSATTYVPEFISVVKVTIKRPAAIRAVQCGNNVLIMDVDVDFSSSLHNTFLAFGPMLDYEAQLNEALFQFLKENTKMSLKSLPGSGLSQACAPGYGGPTCEICPVGAFSLGGLYSECVPCPSGFETASEGATKKDECRVVVPGQPSVLTVSSTLTFHTPCSTVKDVSEWLVRLKMDLQQDSRADVYVAQVQCGAETLEVEVMQYFPVGTQYQVALVAANKLATAPASLLTGTTMLMVGDVPVTVQSAQPQGPPAADELSATQGSSATSDAIRDSTVGANVTKISSNTTKGNSANSIFHYSSLLLAAGLVLMAVMASL